MCGLGALPLAPLFQIHQTHDAGNQGRSDAPGHPGFPAAPSGVCTDQHPFRESGGRLLARQRMAKLLLEIDHFITFLRNKTSDRCKWLFTVARGMSSSAAISVGLMSS